MNLSGVIIVKEKLTVSLVVYVMCNASVVTTHTTFCIKFLVETRPLNTFASSLSVHPCAPKFYKSGFGNCELNYQLLKSSDICMYCISDATDYIVFCCCECS